MLSIDGVHIEKDLGLHLLEGSNEPILSDTRDNDITIPGRHGSYPMESYMGSKPFFEEILIPDQASLRDVQRIVNKIKPLILDVYGKPKPVKLIWDYEPDKYYIAKFSGYISINRIHKAGIFFLPFTAHDPMAKATVENHEINVDSTIVSVDDDYSIDTVWINDVQITTPQTLETYVNGYAIRPTILITGSADNLTFHSNGKSFSLKNFKNSTFEIKGENYTILKNGVNGFNERNSKDFLELLPGMNKIQVTGSNMDFKLSIILRDQYM